MKIKRNSRVVWLSGLVLLGWLVVPGLAKAQSIQMGDLPGYQDVQSAQSTFGKIGRANVSNVHWSVDHNTLYYSDNQGRHQLDLASGELSEAQNEPSRADTSSNSGNPQRAGRVGRAQQRVWIVSPDGKWKARYDNHNMQLQPLDEKGNDRGPAIPVTRDGNETHRFGTACWVYGEELDQNDAMWFSPDSRKLAFYEIDESHMKTYFLTLKNAALYTTLHKEQYPTAGQDNPHVRLHIYDIATEKSVVVDVDGPDDQYIYRIEFSPDGNDLVFHRTNRWQNQLDLMAADVETGVARTILSETQETWQNNAPLIRYLADGHRFVWETEKTGWKQYELRDLDGQLLATLTPPSDYPVHNIVSIDEESGWFYYSAYSDANPLNLQLHRTRLDGSVPDVSRLTPAGSHYSGFQIAPNHQAFLATFETLSDPPSIGAFDMNGNQLAVLSKSDTSIFREENVTPGELFSFTSADGKATIYGQLFKPRNFDASRKYPLLIDVYGGPLSVGVTNRFRPGNPYCELGFVMARIGNRGTVNRGKAFESATYLELGVLDMDDQAAGVRFLAERPYIDGNRVGIYGHSYGGYLSALALLRYPDVFHVGVAGAPVSDWKNYDTIYTERYMRTPAENPQGFKAGSCLTYADKLTGKLFLLHGLVDDNVHPSNTWQLVEALQKAGKRFDLMVYPSSAHGFGYNELKWEYLVRHLKPVPGKSSKP